MMMLLEDLIIRRRLVKDSWIEVLGSPATTHEHDGHCFLPTVSALDLQNQSYGASSNWQSNNLFYNVDSQIQNLGTVNGNDLITPSLSPFKAVITSTTGINAINGYHNGNISAQFATFIERKILNANPLSCAGTNGLCSVNPVITGTQSYCTSTFTISPLPNDITINWSLKYGYLTIVNGQGTSTISITRVQNTVDTLFATLTNGCGANVVIKRVMTIAENPSIVGLSHICTFRDYNIQGLPTGATITWSIIPTSGVASLSTSGNTATLTKIADGIVQLSATIHSACGDVVSAPRDLYVGLPPSPGSTSPSLNPMCPGEIKVVSLLPRAGIDSYLWYTNDSGINVTGNGLSGSVEATAPGTYQLKIRAINSCGYTESTYFVSVRNYGDSRCSGIMYRYSVYPNPAGNEVTVAYVKNEKEQETQKFTKEFSMKLYNDKGKEVMFETNKSEENSFSLNTSKLPEDTYFLHITDDEETIKKQIIIKH
jgi:hypothetical protein